MSPDGERSGGLVLVVKLNTKTYHLFCDEWFGATKTSPRAGGVGRDAVLGGAACGSHGAESIAVDERGWRA